MRLGHTWALLLFSCGYAAAAPPVRADGQGVPSENTVHVFVAGTPAAVEKSRLTITELCARLGVHAVVQPGNDESVLRDTSSAELVRGFVNLNAASPTRVVVVQGDTHRELERRKLPSGASLEVSVEEAAHVIYAAVESLLDARAASASPAIAARATNTAEPTTGSGTASSASASTPAVEVGATRASPTPEPAPTTREAPHATAPLPPPRELLEKTKPQERSHETADRRAAASTVGVEVAAFGSVTSFGASLVRPGAGVSVDAGVAHGAFRGSVALLASASVPGDILYGPTTASLGTESARLFAMGEWRVTRHFAPFIAFGGGADRVAVDTNAPPAGGWAARAPTNVDPVIAGLVGAKVHVSPLFAVFVAGVLDLDVAPHRYVVESAGVEHTFFDLARVRPSAFLGLCFLTSGARRSDDEAVTP